MIPDYFAPIIGYRGWNVDAQGFLTSANQGQRWKARKSVRAICKKDAGGESHWHPETGEMLPAPVAGCDCGYYAYRTEPQSDEYRCKVRGEVKLWGKIIEHDGGYRAQFAYPGAIRCGSAKLAARLRFLYGCECVVDEAMVYATQYAAGTWQSLLGANQIGSTINVKLPQRFSPQVYPPIVSRLDVLYGIGISGGGAGGGKSDEAMKLCAPAPPIIEQPEYRATTHTFLMPDGSEISAADYSESVRPASEDDLKRFALPPAPSTWTGLVANVRKILKQS